MKVGIIGTRSYANYAALRNEMETVAGEVDSEISVIVFSTGTTLSSLCQQLVNSVRKWKGKQLSPNYQKHAMIAVERVNREIIDECDLVVAFWNGKSPNTKAAIEYAKQRTEVRIVEIGR